MWRLKCTWGGGNTLVYGNAMNISNYETVKCYFIELN